MKKIKVFELSTVDITIFKFVLPLMKELRQQGFEVVCGARNCGYLESIKKEGFQTYDISLSRSLNHLALIKSFIQLVQVLKKEKIDIIHVHTPIASFLGRLASIFAKVKTRIYTVHGFVLQPKVFYYIEKLMAKMLTDFMFTVNQEDLDMAVKNKFISQDKAANINSVGIDTDYFDPERVKETAKDQLKENLNLRKGIPVIGYVGRIVKSKGVLDLLNAFIEIRKDMNCQLLLAGPWDLGERSDDIIMQDIRNIINEEHLVQDVLLPGYREDITEVLSIIDIFVLPSYREGMPVSLLEAMAMEKAVIGTDIRGSREEITEDSGLIYEPKDVSGLKKHLEYYLKNADKAAEMGRNARQRVLKHFSLNRVIDKQMKVFLELANDYKR